MPLPPKLFHEHGGKQLILLLLGHELPLLWRTQSRHFCWSSPVLWLSLKLLFCLLGGPWFLVSPFPKPS